MKRRLN